MTDVLRQANERLRNSKKAGQYLLFPVCAYGTIIQVLGKRSEGSNGARSMCLCFSVVLQ